jgi:hypothetical protein
MATPALSADVAPDNSLLFSALLGFSVGVQDASEDKGSPSIEGGTGTELTLAGHGHVSIPLSESFSAQFDVQTEFYDRTTDEDDEAAPQGAQMLGGHLSWRDPETGLIGIFAGVGMGEADEDDEDRNDHVGLLAGVEGQYYLDQFTFYAQAGCGDFKQDEDPDEGFLDGWFARGVARYFFSENFLLQAEVSYGETSEYVDGDSEGQIWNWGALAKMRISESYPIYGTLEYRGGNYEDAEDGVDSVEEHAFLVGLDFTFGAESLWENDRRGATLDTPMLPVRAAAWSQSVD